MHIHCCHLVARIYIAPELQEYCVVFLLHFKYDIENYIQSVSFQMVSRLCISLLQVLSYRQLGLGMSF